MSNPNNPDLQWFKDSFRKLVETKGDEEKASILVKVYTELDKMRNAEKILKPEEQKRPKFADVTHYPTTVKEIKTIVKKAYDDKNTIVRVIGSGHSPPNAIFDASPIDKKVVIISLKNFHGVEIDKENHTVKAKAGTHLNHEPQDSTSKVENSLNYLINKAGYALPSLGGIAHQTVSGFISTGSSGGSLNHSFGSSIIGISIINGKGNEEELTRAGSEDEKNKFFAAGVSMGLLGIITHVTFKLEKNYYIYGSQICTLTAPLDPDYQKGCPIDLFCSDTRPDVPNLYEYFINSNNYDADYSRLYWWPQEKVNRLVIWKAKRTEVKDLAGFDKPIQPYKELPEFFGSQIPAQILANLAYIVLNILYLSDNDSFKEIAAYILSFFNGVSLQSFQDIWYNGLPMDDNVSKSKTLNNWLTLNFFRALLRFQILFFQLPLLNYGLKSVRMLK
jgi:hypothetical protein